jgi:glycosyltransferase involved in cell wall biosynthesis
VLLRSGFSGIRVHPDYRRYSLQHIHERAVHSHRQTILTSTIKLLYHITPSFLKEVRVMKVATSLMIVTAQRTDKREHPMLSVIMPVFNERTTVGETLAAVLNKQIPNVVKEVIVVESNSTDGSRDMVLSYQDHPELKIILEDRPRGKGSAVRTGLANASGDYVLIQDADQEYDVNDYDILVEPLRTYRAAFVLGSRHTGGGKMRELNDQPGLAAYLNFGHWVFCTALNLLYGQRVKDPFTMYKVFRRDCLHDLEFECNRFDFDFELVIKLVRKGYVPLEIPVNYRARSLAEGKKVTILRDPLTWIRALIKFRFSPLYRSDKRQETHG